MHPTYQKLFAALLLIVCVSLGVLAWGYHAPFSYEPVGPRAYPLLILTLLALGAIGLLIQAADDATTVDDSPSARPARIKLATCVVLLISYAALFERLGFIPASLLFGAGLARLYGSRWIISLLIGVLLALSLYFLFDHVMDVPLPLGVLADFLADWER